MKKYQITTTKHRLQLNNLLLLMQERTYLLEIGIPC